jgi:hypothetical protein
MIGSAVRGSVVGGRDCTCPQQGSRIALWPALEQHGQEVAGEYEVAQRHHGAADGAAD